MSTKSTIETPLLTDLPSINKFQLIGSTMGSSGDAVMISQRDCQSSSLPTIVFVNQAFQQITGFSEDEMIGAPAIIVMDATRNMPGSNDIETASFECEVFHRSGELFSATWTVCKFSNANQETWIAVFHENTPQAVHKQ